MNKFLGIDIGTSSVKIVCMNEDGSIARMVSKEYPIYYPRTGWSEQNPNDWWLAVEEGCKEILKYIDKTEIHGISFGGQMHGLVVLDKNHEVIRPAILWNDGRSEAECAYLNNCIGKENLTNYCANIAFAGFTAPKLLWMRKHEPDLFYKIYKIMLPKDYIAYKFTGIFSTDVSDASGMLCFDVEHKKWSKEMLRICGIREEQLPRIFESYEIVSEILPNIAKQIGLDTTTKIVAGAGDNAAAAIGTGTVGDGACNISLGTSGTIFISSKKFCVDPYNALHSFAHADGAYHMMGCILSAASCNKWWMDEILCTDDYEKEQVFTDIKNDVYFLPYMMGERSPHNDVLARGAFVNLSLNTARYEMTQAILEGVAFAIKDCLEVAKSQGIAITRSRICGGGAKSNVWKEIMANVLNIQIEEIEVDEGPGLGAAILAAVGCGQYKDVASACEQIVKVKSVIVPNNVSKYYEKKYKNFTLIYPSLKHFYTKINQRSTNG